VNIKIREEIEKTKSKMHNWEVKKTNRRKEGVEVRREKKKLKLLP